MNPSEVENRVEGFTLHCLAIVRTAEAMADKEKAQHPDQLKDLRDELLALLVEYQTFKHRHVFDPAIACGDPSKAATGRSLKANCIMMGDKFAGHHARWSYGASASQWPMFKLDMVEMVDGLVDHLQTERDAIRRLVGRQHVAASSSEDRCGHSYLGQMHTA